MNKLQRQLEIKEIISTQHIASQDDLCTVLKKRGFDVAQATLSRDLTELGVIRVPSEEGSHYTLHIDSNEKKMQSLIGMEVVSIESNEVQIFIRTLPGRAPGVASFIDALRNTSILGTVAGDDTVFVSPSSVKKIQTIIKMIKGHL